MTTPMSLHAYLLEDLSKSTMVPCRRLFPHVEEARSSVGGGSEGLDALTVQDSAILPLAGSETLLSSTSYRSHLRPYGHSVDGYLGADQPGGHLPRGYSKSPSIHRNPTLKFVYNPGSQASPFAGTN